MLLQYIFNAYSQNGKRWQDAFAGPSE